MMHAQRWALAGMLGLFAAAAAYGMRADLPFSRFATEEEQVFYAVKFGTGDLNPHYFLHPPFFAYVLFGLYGATFMIGRAAGVFASVADFERLFFTDPTLFFLIGRIFVLGLGLLGLWLFFRLAHQLYHRTAIALLATAFLSVSVLHVTAAHYANTDIPMMVLAFLALGTVVRVLQEGRLWHYGLAGLLIGLATATKYNAAWLGVVLGLAHLIRTSRAGAPWRERLFAPKLVAGMGLIIVGFFLGCPYALLDGKAFLASVQKLRWELMTSEYHFASYRAQGSGHWFLLTSVLPSAIGAPLTVVSLIGLAYALWKRRPEDLWLAGLVLTFIGYVGTWDIIKPRYFIYIVPMLLLVAARWCVALADRLRAGPLRVTAMTAGWALLVALPVQAIVRFDRQVAQTPVSVRACAWIQRHVPSGTPVAVAAGVPLVPNEASIHRQLEEIHAKGIGQGIRLQRLARYVPSLPAAYDLWPLPYPWREDFDPDDLDFAKHRQAGVRYVVVTDEVEQYLADPARYPVHAQYYTAVRDTGRLVQEFRGQRPDVDPGLGTEEYVKIYELVG
ncbi:MAG: glycosyltransferase family 39 protein [Candidatus Omnitrophica bacterium]|nr:glycosyltransferase family 39 protein [Candidatus Omnitrophota bacterium]